MPARRVRDYNTDSCPGLLAGRDVTMNVYAHVLPHIQEEAMGRFAERLRVTDSTLAGS
jgi:hypothetical protein